MGLYLIASIVDFGFWWVVLQVAIGLGLMIFVHELGHFAVAKLCGVKCEKFYLGFDIAGLKICKAQWGETEYGIGILPLGGYVKMLGQEDNPARLREELERAKAAKAISDQPDDAGDDAVDIEAAEQALYDPRSYLAQSVPKRMAIISAGVIMNLVFAFVAATIAYGIGVKEPACEVGDLQPGDPAWQADMHVGDRILEINGQPAHRFRDLLAGVSLSGKSLFSWSSSEGQEASDEGVTMRIKRPGLAEEITLTMLPSRDGLIPRIGVTSPWTTTLLTHATLGPCEPGSPAARTTPPFQSGDTITKINDTPVEDYPQIHRQLALLRDEPIQVTVQRPIKSDEVEEFTVQVARRPMRRVGLVMSMGPITAVQANSPAAAAGVAPGDRIVAIDSEPVGDPMTLANRLRGQDGKTIVLSIEREEGTVEIPVVLRVTETYQTPLHEGNPVSVPALGIAYRVLNRVEAVLSDSPAAKAGIQPGDVLLTATLLTPENESSAQEENDAEESVDMTVELDQKPDWPLFFYQAMQTAMPGSRVELQISGNSPLTLEMIEADDWFNPNRGFRFEPLSSTWRAGTLGEAIRLGADETWESATAVLVFLDRLMTQRISPKALIGPVTMARVASHSAAKGLSEFLLFLTLVSANLAVINFLPIPVLDGGHMVFLAWEGIRGKPADERIQLVLSYFGLLFIVGLMVWVIGLDIARLL